MANSTTTNHAAFVDRASWAPAVLSGLFLIIFPVAIVAIWNQPRDVAPLIFVLPFTLIFAACVPYLARLVLCAATRRIAYDADHVRLLISHRGLLWERREIYPVADIAGIVFEETDADGFWYRCLVEFVDGHRVSFAQGSYRPGVREEAVRFVEHISTAKPGIAINDVRA